MTEDRPISPMFPMLVGMGIGFLMAMMLKLIAEPSLPHAVVMGELRTPPPTPTPPS